MNNRESAAAGCPAIKVIAMPKDANASGDIFGGWIVSQIDLAGAVAAVERARGRVVTVAINSVHFKQPVFVGDVVSLYAAIEKIGRTSITVKIEVFSERLGGGRIKVTEATVTYVNIGEDRKPRPVPVE